MNTGTKKGIALVIGNANYITQPKLPSCLSDADNIARALESLKFDVFKLSDGTRVQMLDYISKFLSAAASYSVVLAYYSGHGVQIDGVNYLVPIDFEYDSTKSISKSRMIDMDVITSYMSAHSDNTNILILDACRTSLSFIKGLSGTGLAEVNAGHGMIIAFATSPNTVALCDDNESYYTRCLLKHMAKPNVKIEDMFKTVRSDVAALSSGNQIPWESTSLQKDFCFNTMTNDEIHESIYQLMRNYYSAEILILINQLYDVSISDAYRIYERQKAEKPGGLSINDEQSFEQFVLEGILGMGFELKNYRWIYKGLPVKMGEFFHDYKKDVSPRQLN